MRCPFCQERINAADNPLVFSGARDLGCASCYTTNPLKLARSVRPAAKRFRLSPERAA